MSKVSIEKQLSKIYNDCLGYLNNNQNPFSLLSGNAGIYLFLFLYSKYYDKDISYIQKKFIHDLKIFFNTPVNTFADGISGIGWLLQLLIEEEIIDPIDCTDILKDIDEISYQFAIDSFNKGNNDFLYGPVGEIVYLINRYKINDKVKFYLSNIANKLSDCAIFCDKGVCWYESEIMLEENQKNKEVINFGIAHGLASKIAIYSKLIQHGINENKNKTILIEIIRYMLCCKNKYTDKTIFPAVIENGKGLNSSFWWSYGDLGIAISLWQAGNVLSDKKIINEAESVFTHYADTKMEDTLIYEASLCRGTSGIALMFHNMFKDTGIKELGKASENWFIKTLDMAKYEDGIGGFKFLNNYSLNQSEWFYQNNPSILMGSAGVGLALLSFLKEEKMKWSECILLN